MAGGGSRPRSRSCTVAIVTRYASSASAWPAAAAAIARAYAARAAFSFDVATGFGFGTATAARSDFSRAFAGPSGLSEVLNAGRKTASVVSSWASSTSAALSLIISARSFFASGGALISETRVCSVCSVASAPASVATVFFGLEDFLPKFRYAS